MGRQEGSPLFAESIANYDSRQSRGRQKLMIGAVTVGVALLLTLAIAVPLSVEPDDIKPNSSLPLLGRSTNRDEGSVMYHGKNSDHDQPVESVQSQRKVKSAKDSAQGSSEYSHESQSKSRTERPWWTSTTTHHHDDHDGGDDDDDDDYDDKPWYQRSWKPWWPTQADPPDGTRLPWDPDAVRPPRRPGRRRTGKPWWPWPAKRTTATITTTTTTPQTSARSVKKCRKVPDRVASRTKLGDYANTWWYELARVQSSEVQIPVYLISCSKAYFQVGDSDGKDAIVSYAFKDHTGANQSAEIDLWRTRYPYKWLETTDDQEIQLNFVSRNDTYLLTYECFLIRNITSGYAIRIWSLEPMETINSTARALLDLADSVGLNPDGLAPREIDQKGCS